MTAEEVIAVARTLSPDDRAMIVASIDPAGDEFVATDALRAELNRRWAAYQTDPSNVLTLEQFKAKLATRK